MQINSPIKQRILQYIDYLHISKRTFYEKTGISRGTMENLAGITEDTIVKLFATYENINPTWLITGRGTMLLDGEVVQKAQEVVEKEPTTAPKCAQCEAKEATIADLRADKAHLMRIIEAFAGKQPAG